MPKTIPDQPFLSKGQLAELRHDAKETKGAFMYLHPFTMLALLDEVEAARTRLGVLDVVATTKKDVR